MSTLLEWQLLQMDDETFHRWRYGSTIPGTNIPTSGDPDMDADILRAHTEMRDGR